MEDVTGYDSSATYIFSYDIACQMVIAECVFSILGIAVVIYRRNIVVEIST